MLQGETMLFVLVFLCILWILTGFVIRDSTNYPDMLVNYVRGDSMTAALNVVLINHFYPNDFYGDAEKILQAIEYSTGPFVSKSIIMTVTAWESLMDSEKESALKQLRCPGYKIHLKREEIFIVMVFDDLENRAKCETISVYPDEPIQYFHPVHFPLMYSSTSALSLKSVIERRYQIQVNFYLSDMEQDPVEIAWAHFRGNTRVVSIGGDVDEPLLIYPGEKVVQFTHAGHLFVIKSVKSESDDVLQKCVDGAILALYLIPAGISSNSVGETTVIDITIDTLKSFNIELLEHVAGTQSYYVEKPNVMDINAQKHLQSLLWTYWEYQRRCQIHLNSILVPTLPMTKLEIRNRDFGKVNNKGIVSTTSLWKIVRLPTMLAELCKDDYEHNKIRLHHQTEISISMVFNQHEVDTYYVPLNDSLLRHLETEVIRESSAWLGIPDVEWVVSSSYGAREYRRGAIIRWHVDPTESQPITAIIHIAEGGNDGKNPENAWPIVVPKTLSGTQKDLDVANLEEIFLAEGEMLLLQTAKVPHARLKQLNMDYYSNVFVHIAPRYWSTLEVVQAMY